MCFRCLPVWACLVACIGCSGGPDPGPAATPGEPSLSATSPESTGQEPEARTEPGVPPRTGTTIDTDDDPETREPPPEAPRPKSSTPSSAGAARPPTKKAPASRRAAPEVADLILRLQATPEEAGKAYRQIWEAPRPLIPKLIPEVANDAPSALRELAVLVLDKDFAQVDSKDGSVAYDIPGMGKVKYDDIVVGKAPRGLKVILRRLEKPFPVGAVIRAGLLNRFRSTDYPGGSDVSDPVGWWQRFYDRSRAKL